MAWHTYPNVPWVKYAVCGCQKGGFYVLDTRSKEQFHVPDENGIHQFAADRSGQGARLPLGDYVHHATQKLGFQRCGSCAKRQTWLNRLLG